MLRLGDDTLAMIAGHMSATSTCRLQQCNTRLHKLLEPTANEKALTAYEQDRVELYDFLESYMLSQSSTNLAVYGNYAPIAQKNEPYHQVFKMCQITTRAGMWSIKQLELFDNKEKPVFGIEWGRGLAESGILETKRLLGVRLDEPHWQSHVLCWLNYFMDPRRPFAC
jgi:hypothetical protein